MTIQTFAVHALAALTLVFGLLLTMVDVDGRVTVFMVIEKVSPE